MDYEEMILESQELDYEKPEEELNPPKWYCVREHKYMDCVECGKNCDWTKINGFNGYGG